MNKFSTGDGEETDLEKGRRKSGKIKKDLLVFISNLG